MIIAKELAKLGKEMRQAQNDFRYYGTSKHKALAEKAEKAFDDFLKNNFPELQKKEVKQSTIWDK